MKSLFNLMRKWAGFPHTIWEPETLVVSTQAPPAMPPAPNLVETEVTKNPDQLRGQLIVNDRGLFWVAFPYSNPDWCQLNLTDFVPELEFEDCVFGKYQGSTLKLFKSEISPLEPENEPI
jgi:hypothetical protein